MSDHDFELAKRLADAKFKNTKRAFAKTCAQLEEQRDDALRHARYLQEDALSWRRIAEKERADLARCQQECARRGEMLRRCLPALPAALPVWHPVQQLIHEIEALDPAPDSQDDARC